MGGVYDTGAGRRLLRPKLKPTRKVGLWLIAIGLVSLFVVYLSRTTQMRLAPDPPAKFFEVRPEWNAERRKAEARLAREYWECAVVILQWQYPYGLSLPEKPPAEFQVDVRGLPGGAKPTPESRERYWRNLRKVWSLPQTWRVSHEWNADWFKKPFEFLRGLKDQKDRSAN